MTNCKHLDFSCSAFGLRGAHGHIDFYANGGVDQPGCPKTIFAGDHTHTSRKHVSHTQTNKHSPLYLPPTGKSYFVCDHQRSVFLYLCALNRTCSLTGYPCSSYSSFLEGQCMQCEAFRPASCPVLGEWPSWSVFVPQLMMVWSPCVMSPAGYDVSQWRDTLLKLGQTRVFFSTTAILPYTSERNESQSLQRLFCIM